MLPTNSPLPIQTDRTCLDESQSQMFSLLASAKNLSAPKRAHRKKRSKLEETIPVTINPQIARTPRAVTFAPSLPDSVQPTLSTHPIHINNLSCRLYVDQQSYDTNNNIYHHQMPVPSNSYIPLRASPAFPLVNQSMPRINGDMGSPNTGKFPFLELNRSLGRRPPERTKSDFSTRRSDGSILTLPCISNSDTSSFGQTQCLPSAPASVDVSGKVKAKRPKRTPLLAANQQQSAPIPSAYPEAPHPFIGLPAVIPTSVSDMYQLSRDVSSSSNFAPLTPPASIIPVQSPPINGNYESSAMSLPQYVLQSTGVQTAEGNLPFRPEYSFSPQPGNRLSYDFQRVFAAQRQQYYMLPTNSIGPSLIPMGYASILPHSVPSMSVPGNVKNEQIPLEKSERRTPLLAHSIAEDCTSEQSNNSGSGREKAPSKRRTKNKSPTSAEIRTKKQLKHFSRRNKMAVLKFMMRKRKQQQQEQRPLCETEAPEKAEDKVNSPLPTSDAGLEKGTETSLTDIITPSLKVSFDVTQKIEFISLYYHRRRLPEASSPHFSSVAKTKDNKLDLLLEAVEYLEAWQGTSKVAVDSNE